MALVYKNIYGCVRTLAEICPRFDLPITWDTNTVGQSFSCINNIHELCSVLCV